jgi:hypothetical protein
MSELNQDGFEHEKEFKDMELKDEASTDGATSLQEEYPSTLGLTFMIIALVLAMFLASLDFTIVGTAIPKITEEFHSLDSVRSS